MRRASRSIGDIFSRVRPLRVRRTSTGPKNFLAGTAIIECINGGGNTERQLRLNDVPAYAERINAVTCRDHAP